MNVKQEVKSFIASQEEPKRSEMEELHRRILQLMPGCKLWYDNGRNADNKVVANPTIGYGSRTIKYANGKAREFFQIGMSANTTGISIYILGIKDKSYLAITHAKKLGKASVTGYCIRFKTIRAINVEALEEAVKDGIKVAEGEGNIAQNNFTL